MAVKDTARVAAIVEVELGVERIAVGSPPLPTTRRCHNVCYLSHCTTECRAGRAQYPMRDRTSEAEPRPGIIPVHVVAAGSLTDHSVNAQAAHHLHPLDELLPADARALAQVAGVEIV